jgi:chromate reductase
MMRLLGISGSLRAKSSNTEVLRAMAILTPPDIGFLLEPDLAAIPPFNPDLEGHESRAVLDFRDRVKNSDGIVISSPEYAHGISGVLKNALDWLVGSGEFSGKQVAILNASPRATMAHASLMEIITTMDAQVVLAACVAIPLLGRKLTGAEIAASPELAPLVTESLARLAHAILLKRAP